MPVAPPVITAVFPLSLVMPSSCSTKTPVAWSFRCYTHRSVCLTYQLRRYAHRPVLTELRWAYDGIGEGAARPAPRQGRPRTHHQRFATAFPRARHQRHRHGPDLRGGQGVQADAL